MNAPPYVLKCRRRRPEARLIRAAAAAMLALALLWATIVVAMGIVAAGWRP